MAGLDAYFKSVIEQDTASVVICSLSHEIIYMNPAAVKNYSKRGGAALIGKNLLNCHNSESRDKINAVIDWFRQSADNNIVHESFNEKQQKDVYMVALRDDDGNLIGYYEKHEFRTKDETPFYDMK